MRFLLILALFSFTFLFGQDAAIPDYHGNKESFVTIKDKTFRKELASFTIAAEIEEVKTPSNLKEISIASFGETYAIFKKDSIKVIIKTGVFDKSKHKFEYFSGKFVVKIDGKPFWGTDGGFPKTTIQSVQCIVGKDTINILKSARIDLYNPNLCWKDKKESSCHTRVLVSQDKRRIYIYMLNSDGAGGYEVTWILQDKKYLRRVVDYGF